MENEKFGAFFAEQRAQKKLTQEQVGNVLGVTDKAVSRWERGECFPEITQLPKIAELFGLTVDEIINAQAKPKNLLKICENCKNQKCKKNNYSQLVYCRNSFHWTVYGIGVASLFMFTAILYLIIRVVDGKWTDWRLPVILGLIYIGITAIASMLFSLKDTKKVFESDEKNDEKELKN